MSLKKKQPTASEKLQHVAKITASVKALEERKVLKIEGSTVFLFPELWTSKKTAEAWMKNLYIYCSVVLKYKKENILYFRSIESSQDLGYYTNGKATYLLQV